MINKGGLRTESWCNHTSTLNSLLLFLLILTLLTTSLYMTRTALISHLWTSSFQGAKNCIRSTKAKSHSLLLVKYLCNIVMSEDNSSLLVSY